MPLEALLKLYYHALVRSNLLHGPVVAWGSTFPTYLNHLVSLQNQAVKMVVGGKFRDIAASYYIDFDILKPPVF